ncbi:MAG: DUF1573 domain-containing protein [Sphingobacteriales bacterium]|nr:MAG: DUF1573 domain-containing protein [Sphingobacteriales bacterium]
MKKIIFAMSMLSLAACGSNETASVSAEDSTLLSTDLVSNPVSATGDNTAALSEMATMDFKDSVHNFGNLKEGEVGTYDFEFANNGKKPLIIASASGSCGCTVPEYPHEPIAPGKNGVIKVKFDTQGKIGHQEKSVTINTNSGRGMHMLYIKAEVEEKN